LPDLLERKGSWDFVVLASFTHFAEVRGADEEPFLVAIFIYDAKRGDTLDIERCLLLGLTPSGSTRSPQVVLGSLRVDISVLDFAPWELPVVGQALTPASDK
jgi:hypothetical protein